MERPDNKEYGTTDSEGDHHFKKIRLYVALINTPKEYMREADAGGPVMLDPKHSSRRQWQQKAQTNPNEKGRDYNNADKPRDDAQWTENRRRMRSMSGLVCI